jgi:hypothetical protein
VLAHQVYRLFEQVLVLVLVLLLSLCLSVDLLLGSHSQPAPRHHLCQFDRHFDRHLCQSQYQ